MYGMAEECRRGEERDREEDEGRGQQPEVPLGADVGPDAEVHEEAGLLGELDEADEVVAVAEVVLALLGFVPVPEDVGLDHVEAAVLGLLEKVRPHLRRAAWVVDGAGDEDPALPVDHHRPVVVRHRRIGWGRGDDDGQRRRRRQQGQEEHAAGHHGAVAALGLWRPTGSPSLFFLQRGNGSGRLDRRREWERMGKGGAGELAYI